MNLPIYNVTTLDLFNLNLYLFQEIYYPKTHKFGNVGIGEVVFDGFPDRFYENVMIRQ
jgi:hypothetical protein